MCNTTVHNAQIPQDVVVQAKAAALQKAKQNMEALLEYAEPRQIYNGLDHIVGMIEAGTAASVPHDEDLQILRTLRDMLGWELVEAQLNTLLGQGHE